jgi:AraC-like DNA-binding protein
VPPTRSEQEKSSPSRVARKDPVVEIWRAPGFKSIELHSGSKISQEYPRHWHDELYLCAIIDGAARLQSPGHSYSTPPVTLVLIPPCEIHANWKLGCTFRCMFIENQALQAELERFTEQAVPEMSFRTELIRSVKTMTSFLRTHQLLGQVESELARDSAVMLFFHALGSRHSTANLRRARDGNEDPAVRRAQGFLDEHYAERVSLEDLARFAGLSPYHLHRSFCRKIGMPPHGYQTQVRIHHARRMLRRGRSISEVACSSGFVDQSHFARHFKKLTGATPGQYIQSYSKIVQDGPFRSRLNSVV